MEKPFSDAEKAIVNRLKRADEIAGSIRPGGGEPTGRAFLACKAYDELLRLEKEDAQYERLKHSSPG